MIKTLIKWLGLTIAVIITAYIVPGIAVTTFLTALFVALVLGLINIFIKPVLTILTLPINILTLGIIGILINTGFLYFASVLVKGFTITGFWAAVIGSILISFIMWMLDTVLIKK
jgi:putative membrane protein